MTCTGSDRIRASSPRPPTCGRCWPTARSGSPTVRRSARGCRTPIRCAARPRSPAPCRDTMAHARRVAEVELGAADRQSGDHPRRPGGVQRQLPRRPDRIRAGLLGHRGRRSGQHRRAAYGPLPGSGRGASGLAPFLADDPGVDSGPHDRPVHPGGDRLRAQAPGRTGVGRLHPQLGDAGGPRLDGLGGRPETAPGRRRADPGAGHRVADRGAWSRAAGSAAAGTGHRGRDRRPREPPGRRLPDQTAGLPPRSKPPSRSSPRAVPSQPPSPSPAPLNARPTPD